MRELIVKLIYRIYSYFLQLKALLLFGRRVRAFGSFTVAHPWNVKIGANCRINQGVFILAHNLIEIQSGVVLSAGCKLIDTGLNFVENFGTTGAGHIKGQITIEADAWIGAGAIILPGVTVGRGSIVGAGSVVTRDVPPFSVVAGIPARVIKMIGKNPNE